ncbi:MAG: acyloxyacyl hydrolase [Hyphomicrobiaceae bacterium]|nr:acyloxyacyl hydrolase [Hyphomicrobiaceae bacterium]
MKALIVAAATLVAGTACGLPACAQDPGRPGAFEIKGGILWHDVPDLWSGFGVEKGVDVNAEVLLGTGWYVLGGTLRPALGGSFSTSGYTNRGYIDARWEVDFAPRLFLGLGIGAALHDGKLDPAYADRKALGSRVLFHVPIELGLRLDARQSLSIYFEHMSNGNTARYNEALDSLGLRYGVRF